ncbi:unnamed protein product [Cladocopium goreaui]|uniref:ubiquitinyl hydrolase 1 n=1 Tax=Cladocopium goreaui TaxID=2562237 RepID=A0A9P1CV64_9DINO|nr:unnamed protein product [Cladocopium goreaui]
MAPSFSPGPKVTLTGATSKGVFAQGTVHQAKEGGAEAQAYAVHCGIGRSAQGIVGVTAILKPGTLPHVQLIESKAASEALIRVAEGLTQQRHALQSYLEGMPTAILNDPGFKLEQENRPGVLSGPSLLTADQALSMMIYQAPNFLVLHLKRFRFMERGKVVKIVPFPPVLNLRPYLCKGAQGEGRPVNYDLRAVIVHVDKAGYSHFGHYIAFVKGATHRKGVFRWFLIDDSIIQEVEEEFVLRQQAYLLFYIRISGGSEATSSEKKRGAKGTEEATLPSRCKGLGGAVCSFFASHDGLCTRCYQEEHGRPPPTSDPATKSAGSANGSTPTSNGYAEKAAAKPAAVPAGVPGKAGKSASSAKKKVGPNDPCPCGSGKKYKKCHGGV